jgi:phosphatidylinositol alpha-1,6-mannosyltransferase
MNILFLTDYYLPHAGGARVYYYNLYKNLVARFTDKVTVLTKRVPGWEEFDRRESSDSLRIIRRFKPLKDWKYYRLPQMIFPLIEAVHLARKGRMDLLHFGDLFPPGVISLALKHYLGIPYVAYSHGEEITLADHLRYQPRVRDRIYLGADAVVAASEFARQNLLRIGVPESRVHKITPGVDCDRFRPMAPNPDLVRQLSLQNKRVLLTVGRLCARKNHRAAILAVAKIVREFRDLAYLIVGEGEDAPMLRRLVIDLGLNDTVRFLGYVPEEQLPELYALSELFVLPNHQESNGDIEGFGMVFLEANAAGKAVIAGCSGGTGESVLHGTTGMLIDPDDVDELAAALRFLLLNPEVRRKMGEVGLRRARAEFSWMRRAESLHQISSDVVQVARASSRAKIGCAASIQSSKSQCE